jgi:dTMP kinase
MFIAFEGLDGSGSSTQAAALKQRLETAGKTVLITKEPTPDSREGLMIRAALRHQWDPTPEELQLLFCADRANHLRHVIEPALEAGHIVITDRYLLSTIAYGTLDIPDIQWLKDLNRRFRLPDLTLLLELPPSECVRRIQHRGAPTELFETETRLAKVWEGYLEASAAMPALKRIDANQTIEAVSETIWQTVQQSLNS